MNKTEYMNALKQALDGLPAETIEETMWTYERKFVDAMVEGRSEEDIAAGLPQPGLVAAQKRAGVHYQEVKKDFSVGNVAGLFVSLIGLAVFNLFMIIPATVYFCLLFASYVSALAFYGAGIGITAASISGVDNFNFDIPSHHQVVINESGIKAHRGGRNSVHVDIGPSGIMVDEDESVVVLPADSVPASQASSAASNAAGTAASVLASAPASAVVAASASSADEKAKIHVKVGNRVSAHHIWKGLGLLLGGIALFLFSLCMTRYTFIGFKHYLQWNISLLRMPMLARAA